MTKLTSSLEGSCRHTSFLTPPVLGWAFWWWGFPWGTQAAVVSTVNSVTPRTDLRGILSLACHQCLLEYIFCPRHDSWWHVFFRRLPLCGISWLKARFAPYVLTVPPCFDGPITPDRYSLVFYLHPFRISATVFVFDGSHWHQLLQHYFLKVSFSAMTLCSHFHKRASVSALCGLVSTNPLSVPVQLLPILKYCSLALSLESLGHLHHPLAFSLRNILLVPKKK